MIVDLPCGHKYDTEEENASRRRHDRGDRIHGCDKGKWVITVTPPRQMEVTVREARL